MTDSESLDALRRFVEVDRLKSDLETALEQVVGLHESAKEAVQIALIDLGVNSCPVSVPESIVRVTPVGCGYFVTLTDRDGNALDGENLLTTLRGLGYLDAPTPRSRKAVTVSMSSEFYVALRAGCDSRQAADTLIEMGLPDLTSLSAKSQSVSSYVRDTLANITQLDEEIEAATDLQTKQELKRRREENARTLTQLQTCYDFKERRKVASRSSARSESASAKASEALKNL